MSNSRSMTTSWLMNYMGSLNYNASTAGMCFGWSVLGAQAAVTDTVPAFNHHYMELKNSAEQYPATPISHNLQAILDSIVLIQQPEVYADLYGQDYRLHQSSLIGLPLIAIKEVVDKGGLTYLPAFTGAYTRKDMHGYLNSLTTTLSEQTLPHPFAIVLRSDNHAITIFYHGVTHHWHLINGHMAVEIPAINTNDILVNAIFKAFGTNEICCLSSMVFCMQATLTATRSIVSAWKDKTSFRDIHQVSATRVTYQDDYGSSWLRMTIHAKNNTETSCVLSINPQQSLVQKRSQDGQTNLYLACLLGQEDSVALLLDHGTDPNSGRKDGKTPLMIAAQQGHAGIIHLLAAKGAKPNTQCFNQSGQGETALYYAALANQPDCIDALGKIDGIDLDIQCGKYKTTALMTAAWKNHVDCARKLIALGANIALLRSDGKTAYEIAEDKDYTAITDLLMRRSRTWRR